MIAEGKGVQVETIYYNGGAGCRWRKAPGRCLVNQGFSKHSWGMAMDLNPQRSAANPLGIYDDFGSSDG